MKKPRILQMIGEFTSGGAESIVVDLTNRLRVRKWEVVVSARSDGPLSTGLADRENVVFIEKRKALDTEYLGRLCRLIRSRGIDLVHAHLFGNNLFGLLAAKLTGVKVIQTIHGMDSIASVKRVLAYKLMAPFVDKVVTVSDSLEREMLRAVPSLGGKLVTIRNGIDLERHFSPTDGGSASLLKEFGIFGRSPLIGAVGNIKPVKGYDILMRAIGDVVRHHPQAVFVIVGDYSDNLEHKQYLDKLIDEQGISDHVVFTGFRKDAGEILCLFDAYVMPSRSEGLSMALLEAMALGKPIVATEVGGNVHVITDDQNGLLVKPNDPASLSERITMILTNEDLSRRLGESARTTAMSGYSADRMVEDYERLYIELTTKN